MATAANASQGRHAGLGGMLSVLSRERWPRGGGRGKRRGAPQAEHVALNELGLRQPRPPPSPGGVLWIPEAAFCGGLIDEVTDGDEGAWVGWVGQDLAGQQSGIAGAAAGPVLMQGDDGILLTRTRTTAG